MALGEAVLTNPTVKQAASLFGVCVPYVNTALELTADRRADLVSGYQTIVLLKSPPPAPESLAEHFVRSTPAEWLEAARTVGIGAVWDRMISPLV